MNEPYRIIIDVKTDRYIATDLMQQALYQAMDRAKNGKVALYRIHYIQLEKAMFEKAELIRVDAIP